jgi:hypothetical protein
MLAIVSALLRYLLSWFYPKLQLALENRTSIVPITILRLLTLAASVVQAQDFSIDWWTIDGGCSSSIGGSYEVTGTVGQPDAGVMSGGPFTLQGGFWPGIIVTSTDAVTLFIQCYGDAVIISWSPATDGLELQTTTDLTKPVWTTAPSGNPVTIRVMEPARFYRLTKP